MVKKLELEALTAEVASLGELLRTRTPEEDPIGYFQYSQRKAYIQERIVVPRRHFVIYAFSDCILHDFYGIAIFQLKQI